MANKKAKTKKTSKQKKPKNKKVRDALAISLSILGVLVIVAIILLLKFCHNPKKDTVLDIQKNDQGQTVCYGFKDEATIEEILKEFPKELIIPEGVQIVASDAFVNDTGSSTIPAEIVMLSFQTNSKCSEIGNEAFKLAQFSTISLPLNIRTIGEDAFASNKAITRIDFPNKLEYVGDKAFENCVSLSEIHVDQFDNIPGDLFKGPDVFLNKPQKGTIFAKDLELALGWKKVFSEILKFTFDKDHWIMVPDVEETVLDIEGSVLKGFKPGVTKEEILKEFKDEKMIIPNTVTSVSNDAFRDEDPNIWSRSIPEEISSVTFEAPEKIQDIGARAFAFNKFEMINLNNMSGLESIGEHAFVGCLNLKTFANGDNTLSLCDNVTYIGMGAFDGCEAIKSIKLPAISKVAKICEFAFATGDLTTIDCSKLEIVLDGAAEYSSDCSMRIWMENPYIFSGLGTNGSIILPKYDDQSGVWDKTTAFLLAETREESVLSDTNSGFNWIFSNLSIEEGIKLFDWTLVE